METSPPQTVTLDKTDFIGGPGTKSVKDKITRRTGDVLFSHTRPDKLNSKIETRTVKEPKFILIPHRTEGDQLTELQRMVDGIQKTVDDSSNGKIAVILEAYGFSPERQGVYDTLTTHGSSFLDSYILSQQGQKVLNWTPEEKNVYIEQAKRDASRDPSLRYLYKREQLLDELSKKNGERLTVVHEQTGAKERDSTSKLIAERHRYKSEADKKLREGDIKEAFNLYRESMKSFAKALNSREDGLREVIAKGYKGDVSDVVVVFGSSHNNLLDQFGEFQPKLIAEYPDPRNWTTMERVVNKFQRGHEVSEKDLNTALIADMFINFYLQTREITIDTTSQSEIYRLHSDVFNHLRYEEMMDSVTSLGPEVAFNLWIEKYATSNNEYKVEEKNVSMQSEQSPAEEIIQFVETYGNDFFNNEAHKSRTERHNIGFEKIIRDNDGNVLSRERLPPDTIEKFEQQTSNDTNTSIEYTGVNDCKNVSQEFAHVVGKEFPRSKIEVVSFIYQDQLDDYEMYHSIIVVTNPDNSQQFIDITHKQIDLKNPVAIDNISNFADYYPGLIDYYTEQKDWNRIFVSREEISQPSKSIESSNKKTSSDEPAKSEKPAPEAAKSPDTPLPPWKNSDVPRGTQAFFEHLMKEVEDGNTDLWDQINTGANSQHDPVLLERFKQYAYDQGIRPGILDQDDIDRRNGLRAEESQHQKTEARKIGRVAKGLVNRALGKQPDPIPPGRGAVILESEKVTNKNWSQESEDKLRESTRLANEAASELFPSQDPYRELRDRPSFQTVPGAAPAPISASESRSQPKQEQPIEQKQGGGKPGYFADLLGFGPDVSTPAPYGYEDWSGIPRTEPVQPEPESSVPENMDYNPWSFGPTFTPKDQPQPESYNGPVDFWGNPAKEQSEPSQDAETYDDPMNGIAEFFGFGENQSDNRTSSEDNKGEPQTNDRQKLPENEPSNQTNTDKPQKTRGPWGSRLFDPNENKEIEEKTQKKPIPTPEKPKKEFKFPGFGRGSNNSDPEANAEPSSKDEGQKYEPSRSEGQSNFEPDTEFKAPSPKSEPSTTSQPETSQKTGSDKGPDGWQMPDPINNPGPENLGKEVQQTPPAPEDLSRYYAELSEKGEETGLTPFEQQAYDALIEYSGPGSLSPEAVETINSYANSDSSPAVNTAPAVDAISPAEK